MSEISVMIQTMTSSFLPLSVSPTAEEKSTVSSSSGGDTVQLLPSSRMSHRHFTLQEDSDSGDSISLYESRNL